MHPCRESRFIFHVASSPLLCLVRLIPSLVSRAAGALARTAIAHVCRGVRWGRAHESFQRLIHARVFRSPMGKGTKKSSAQDVLFYELSSCARDANAAQALLAFDAAAGTVPGAFQARIYHKLLALLVDRPSDSARVRQHMDERGVERDETMVPPNSLLPHRVPAW